MKEQGSTGPIRQERLTTQAHPLKLEIRGDIFMPTEPGQGESPPAPRVSEAPAYQSAERASGRVISEEAQQARDLLRLLKPLPENAGLDERRTYEMMRNMLLERAGIPPITGGSGEGPEDSGEGGSGNGPETPPSGTPEPNEPDQTGSASAAHERGFGFYLQSEDMEILNDGDEGPLRWLESQFDTIYKVAGEGQELSSPVVSNIQTVVSEAIRYLQYSKADKPEILGEFISSFSTRLNLIFMRSAIDHRSMDSAKEMSERLQAHGLLTALSMEDGNVNRMFGRMAELLEDKRLAQAQLMDELSTLDDSPQAEKRRKEILKAAPEFHITPEMMSRLQDDLISEQLLLAERGVGQYKAVYDAARVSIEERQDEIKSGLQREGKTPEQIQEQIGNLIKAQARKTAEPQVRRSVRTAYDALVVSQRQAVIVARGHRLPGPVENYMSDPAGLFNVFNYEDLLTGKFNIFNKAADKFLTELKRDIAIGKLGEKKAKELTDEELLDYGKRMFRDLFAVPDFFSSGWRIEGITTVIGRRISFENEARPDNDKIDEKDLALFLRLKAPVGETPAERKINRQLTWKRIAEIRPEEIVRLYRERAGGNSELTDELDKFFEGDEFVGFRVEHEGNIDAFATYDKFKKEFGPLIQALRQQGYDNFKALRIGKDGFNDDQKIEVTKYFGGDESIGSQKAEQLQAMLRHLTGVAQSQETIDPLMNHDKFEDIYARTLLVDDALLDKLESPPKETGITPLSRYWSSEIGGDALVRNYKDTENAAKAASNLLKFIYTEDEKERLKAAEDFADLTSQYNGQEGRATCIRYTVGSFLNMSKQDFIWDALGVGKLPFRKAMSTIEKIYGPQAKPMSRDTLRVQLDRIHSQMVSAIDRTGKTAQEIKDLEDKAESTYRDLERLLEVTGKDMVKRRAVSFLIYLILAAAIETYHVVDIKAPGEK